MADFSHLAATMERMRRPGQPETKTTANSLPVELKNAPYYVGTLSQDAVELAMVNNGKGDFVVRASERIPNSLVLMVKLTNVTGMQRRIMYHGGIFVMELNGETRSHANLNALLKMEPSVLRPVAKSVLAFHKNSSGGQMRSRSSSASGQDTPPVRTHASPRQLLEDAMTQAENSDFDAALRLVETARQHGASERNIIKATQYIKSLSVAQRKASGDASKVTTPAASNGCDAQNQPPPGHTNISPSKSTTSPPATATTDPVARGTADSGGTKALCEVTADCRLTLLLEGATGVDQRHKWPLPLLRRYGRRGGAFYFEAGRRCASGPALVFLDTPEVEAVFTATETALARFRQQAANRENAQAQSIAAVQEIARQEDVKSDMRRKQSMHKYNREALTLAKKQIKEQQEHEAAERAQREARERKEAEERENQAAHHAEAMRRQKKLEQERKDKSATLKLSRASEAKMAPKTQTTASALFGGDAAQEEWGAGKSKIWKALNPKPLYYQTARDRREREESTIAIGMLGTRNYNVMRDMITPGMTSPEKTSVAPQLTTMHESGGEEMVNEEADYNDDVADEFEDAVAASPTTETASSVGEDPTSDEEEEDDEVTETDIDDANIEGFAHLMGVIEKNRAQRAKEEAERKVKLAEEYRMKKEAEQIKLDKELAVIEARRKLEQAEKDRAREEAVREAQQRIETELVFDFSFN